MQVNFNTAVGITAMLNERRVNNAELISAKDLPSNTILKVYQTNKSATCELKLTATGITRGTGTLCHRLNIVQDPNNNVLEIKTLTANPD